MEIVTNIRTFQSYIISSIHMRFKKLRMKIVYYQPFKSGNKWFFLFLQLLRDPYSSTFGFWLGKMSSRLLSPDITKAAAWTANDFKLEQWVEIIWRSTMSEKSECRKDNNFLPRLDKRGSRVLIWNEIYGIHSTKRENN